MPGSEFTKEEVKNVVSSSYVDGAPCPDGHSSMFYQTFWDIVKHDLIAMFNAWYRDDLD
jgi:hypothetical protein